MSHPPMNRVQPVYEPGQRSVNAIRTTKYRFYTFLPKNIYHQFHRIANVYFLWNVIINFVPGTQVFQPILSIFPLAFVLGVTAIKDAIEDLRRYRADKTVNSLTAHMLTGSEFSPIKWQYLPPGAVVLVRSGDAIPADILLLATAAPHDTHIAFVDTMNLDGETNLKARWGVALQCTGPLLSLSPDTCTPQLLDSVTVNIGPPDTNMFKINATWHVGKNSGRGTPVALENILLRGSVLRSTDWAIGVVLYTGPHTKVQLNSTVPPLKTSKLERDMNPAIMLCAVLLVLMCSSTSLGSYLFLRQHADDNPPYLHNDFTDLSFEPGITFLASSIVFQIVIPIAIYVSFEIVKLGQVYFIEHDVEMYDEQTDRPASCRALNINEDLGQITYIFSDKTGTLTANEMVMVGCAMPDGLFLGSETAPDATAFASQLRALVESDPAAAERMCVGLALCNTVIPDAEREGVYHAESVDEGAFVRAMSAAGFRLKARSPRHITLARLDGTNAEYQLLATIPFTNARKRMSVLLRGPDHVTRLLCKGADSAVFGLSAASRAHPGNKAVSELEGPLVVFARQGLRTMALADRVLDDSSWVEGWLARFNAVEPGTSEYTAVVSEMECDLRLLGITAVEDRLQDGVPSAIARLREANITIWVLTGDKQETAVEIAMSSRLIAPDMTVVTLDDTHTEANARAALTDALSVIEAGRNTNEKQTFAAIVAGSFLHTIQSANTRGQDLNSELWGVLSQCAVVVCSRVTPLQKALVVNLARRFDPEKLSLAIGDGANDVSMILEANVGVGISGNEGTQAVMASDFAISQFRFLAPLLLVHGHYSYLRNSVFVLYTLFKSVQFCMVLYWFMYFNGFSGQSALDPWNLVFFNSIYTTLPPIILALFDRDYSRDTLLANPALYRVGQLGTVFNLQAFFWVLVEAMYQSVVVFFVGYGVYRDGLDHSSLWEFGTAQMFVLLLVVNFEIVLYAASLTRVVLVVTFVSTMIYFPITLLVTASPTDPSHGVLQRSLTSPLLWLTVPLLFVVCIAPRYAATAYQRHLSRDAWPSNVGGEVEMAELRSNDVQ